MKKIRFWIRRYFAFSQRETNGFIILLLITILAIVIPLLYNPAPVPYDISEDQALLDSLAAELDQEAISPKTKTPFLEPSTPIKVKLHPFNPNTVTLEELQALGVPKFAAQNLIKYREKAGSFLYKEQFQKIYGLPDEVYQQLYPFINLPEASNYFKNKPNVAAELNKITGNNNFKNRTSFRLQPFDINTADTTQLKKIRGIGSKLSARIVKFRDKLGALASEEQLTEVYGLSPEVIDSLHKYSFVNPDYTPKQISINTASFEELRLHPYIGFNLAKVILSYRTQHGPFKQLDELKNIKVLDDKQYQRLRPYVRL